MEYLFVQFDPADRRNLVANGNVIGQTDTEVTLPADFYRIFLSGSYYSPPVWEGPIAGTQPTAPMRIVFTHA
jgi:hypothetical protein